MYIKLFLTFAYIGAFTFGGGYSMLPMFQRVLVEKRRWVTENEVADLFSISQCLPGIIAANTAIFVGHKHKGSVGGIAAALGVVFPSILIILIIAAFLSGFADIPAVQSAFVGLRVCVSVLIINAVFKLHKHALVDLPSIIIFLVVFTLSVFTSLHITILVAAAGICGIVISSLRKGAPPTDPGHGSCDSKDKSNTSEGGVE
jgi:chromate transporter